MTISLLRSVVDNRQYEMAVWPSEGQFCNKIFTFNDELFGSAPALIDMQTANVVLTIYDNLNPRTKLKFAQKIENERRWFVFICGKCWEWVS